MSNQQWNVHPWVKEAGAGVRFGVMLTDSGAHWQKMKVFAREVEELGYDSLWVVDHPGMGFSDNWVSLTVLAEATKSIRLGTFVNCICYRSPWELARLTMDVDRVSDGRLILGLGIGDADLEFEQLAIPLPSIGERQKMLAETISILQGLWSGEPFTFTGRYYQVNGARFVPRASQQPRIPLLIGGGGEKVTLRQVAQYADMSNFAPHPWTGNAYTHEDITRKLSALQRHCDSYSRPMESIVRSYAALPLVMASTEAEIQAKIDLDPTGMRASPEHQLGLIAGTPEQMIPYYQALIDLGLNYFIAAVWPEDRETITLLAREVIPHLRPPRQ